MCKRTAFIGHRYVFDENIREKLYIAVEEEIKNGCNCFTMGTRGDFDKEALFICRELRQKYKEIKIEVVITSFAQIKPILIYDDVLGKEVFKPYDDVETVMYEIENLHFKKRITESNKQMIDACNTLICYVDEKCCRSSGAKKMFFYAKKKGLRIVNLFLPSPNL